MTGSRRDSGCPLLKFTNVYFESFNCCIPSINIATQLEFVQNYLILFTFCNNLLIQFEFCKKYVPFFWGYSSQRDTLQQSKHLKGQFWPRVSLSRFCLFLPCPPSQVSCDPVSVCHVFAYSCPAPPPRLVVTPCQFVTFLLIPALPPLPGQLWPRVSLSRFCLFLPWPPSPVQSCYDWIKHNIFGKRIIWKIQNKYNKKINWQQRVGKL